MHCRLLKCCMPVVGILATVIVAPLVGQSKSAAKPASTTSAPRTAWGAPDLEGVWDFSTVTPMERPKALADKAVLSAAEAAAFEQEYNRIQNRDLIDPQKGGAGIYAPESAGGVVPYNEFWYSRGNQVQADNRTSLIVSPADGRIPWTEEGRRRIAEEAEEGRRSQLGRGRADNPEDFSVGVRCIVGFNAGPPIMPSSYNNNVQVVQTPDTMVIVTEMVHDARVIPLDGRPHGKIRQWSGDSRGKWEGNTLVIDTTNFSGTNSFPGSSANMHLVERLTRIDANTIRYEFTVDDPKMWTKAWTAAVLWKKNPGRVYEYACHEGNYAMVGMLQGARAREKAK